MIHVLNLHAVLQTGQLFILSHGTHIDTQNCVALLPTGKLHSCLCVCKSTLSVPAYRISTAGPSGLCVQYGSVHLSASVSLSWPTLQITHSITWPSSFFVHLICLLDLLVSSLVFCPVSMHRVLWCNCVVQHVRVCVWFSHSCSHLPT